MKNYGLVGPKPEISAEDIRIIASWIDLNLFGLFVYLSGFRKGRRMKRLFLSRTDRKIAGICGGIAETFDIDPTIVRLLLVVLALVTAVIPVVLGYLLAWWIIPEKELQSPGPH